MSSFVRYGAAICAALSAWLLRGAVALQSAAPGAPKVGLLPAWWELGLFLLAAVGILALLRPATDRLLPLFATVICMLPWVPGIRVPALLVWTGPLGAAAWAGAACATLFAGCRPFRTWLAARLNRAAFRDPGRAPFAAAAGACAFFALVAFGARGVGPTGDEPHYLILTQSLLYDRDLQIENNHARRDYDAYFPRSLQPDFRRGQNGAMYSVHSPGLPLLVGPAFLAGGYRGVVAFLVVVAALGIGLLWRLAYAVAGRVSAAWLAVAATAGATPVAFQSFAVYPDGAAGVIVLTGIWALCRVAGISDIRPGSVLSWLLHGAALAVLPWMHTRFAALAGPLAAVILLRMPRSRGGLARAGAFLVVPAASALAWFAFFLVVYGTSNPAAQWMPATWSSVIPGGGWKFIPGGLAGTLFDQQFGAIPYAPVVVVGAAGWLLMLKRDRRLALELAAVAVPYMLVTTQLQIWWGGASVPARFWTPLLWLGGIPAASAWAIARKRVTRGTALALLLVSVFTTLGLAYASGGALAYNVRDGYATWFAWLSPMTDVPLGLPSFFRLAEQQGTYRLQILLVLAVFTAAFLTLVWLDARVRAAEAFALLLLTTYAAAAMIVMSVLWWANAATGVRVSAGQLYLIGAARDRGRVGVMYLGGLARVLEADAVLQSLRIESPPRLAAGSDPPALVLPGWIPAGRYRLEAASDRDAGPGYEVRVLNRGPAIVSGTVPARSKHVALTVTLPADAPALILHGRGLRSGFLRPLSIAAVRERFGAARANSARRYGNTIVWFVNRNAFDDPGGLWTAGGGAEARVLFQPDTGTNVRVLVRNGPMANDVDMRSDRIGWRATLSMTPGQEHEVEVPVDTGRGAVLLRVVCSTGFRPSEVERGSRDTRLLGVWMLPR